jgi:hypothetical protein
MNYNKIIEKWIKPTIDPNLIKVGLYIVYHKHIDKVDIHVLISRVEEIIDENFIKLKNGETINHLSISNIVTDNKEEASIKHLNFRYYDFENKRFIPTHDEILKIIEENKWED